MVNFWGDNASWVRDPEPGVHEAGYLKLDASRARAELAWQPRLRLETALDWLVRWYKAQAAGDDVQKLTLEQIGAYEQLGPAR